LADSVIAAGESAYASATINGSSGSSTAIINSAGSFAAGGDSAGVLVSYDCVAATECLFEFLAAAEGSTDAVVNAE